MMHMHVHLLGLSEQNKSNEAHLPNPVLVHALLLLLHAGRAPGCSPPPPAPQPVGPSGNHCCTHNRNRHCHRCHWEAAAAAAIIRVGRTLAEAFVVRQLADTQHVSL